MSHLYTGKTSLIAVAVAMALVGCGGGGGSDSTVEPSRPEIEVPKLPTLDELGATPSEQYIALLNQAGDFQSKVDPYGFSIGTQGVAAKRAVDEGLLSLLNGINRDALKEDQRIFYDMLKWDLEVNIEGYKLPMAVVPIHHFRNYVVDRASNVAGTAPKVRLMAAASPNEATPRIDDYYGGSTAVTLRVAGRNDIDCASHAEEGHIHLARAAAAATTPLDWYQDRLKWIKAYNNYLDDVKAGFEQGKARSMILPKRLVDRMIAQFDGKIEGGKLAGYDTGYKGLSGLGADEAFKAEYLKAVTASNDKFIALRGYLAKTYVGRPDSGKNGDGYLGMDDPKTKGVHEGQEMYKWHLKKNTTALMTPDAVHEDGLEMVAGIYSEMKKVCLTVGKCASATPSDAEMKAFLQGYLNEAKFRFDDLNKTSLWSKAKNPDTIEIAAFDQYGQNPDFSPETWQQVQAEIDAKTELNVEEKGALKKHYQALYDYYQFKPRMAAQIDGYFLPESQAKADYGIRPVTWEDSPYDGVAYYTGNNFYLNTYSPYMINSWSLSTLLAHEAAPGHHFQIALGNELKPSLPKYAAKASYTAYAEGWALYTEALAEEMGMYTGNGLYSKPAIESSDPKVEGSAAFNNQLEYFGRLNEDQMRAMRRVVDTGIHWKGWSHDKAVQYMKDNSALGDGDISSEVPRYMAYVGQATSYKAGQVSIANKRIEAKEKLGSRFDLKKYHHQVLSSGRLPLSVLEAKIDNWIRAGGQ